MKTSAFLTTMIATCGILLLMRPDTAICQEADPDPKPTTTKQESQPEKTTDESPSDQVQESEPADPVSTLKEQVNTLSQQLKEVTEKVDELTKDDESSTSSAQQPPAEPAQPRQRPTRTRRGNEPKPVPQFKIEPEWLKQLNWRSIGPANMSGRVTDLVVHDQDPSLWWIATASGGLLKTRNRGTTIEHQFDREETVSIGAIAADPKSTEVIWVGTGEANPRNSVSYGNGVYKSIDGGKTFEHVGLEKTYQIGRILIHPENTDVVYVGALGRLYGPNRERGVFKTADGGKTWEHVLYVDDHTGVIDMIMSPTEPDTIIAALWDRQRDEFDSWPGSVKRPEGIDSYDPIRKWGSGAGLYKTTDGGQNWKKLSEGLPPGKFGRVGLDWQSKSPHTIFAIIDCEDIGKGPKPFDAFLGLVGRNVSDKAVITQVYTDSPAAKGGAQPGDVLTAVDGTDVANFDDLLATLRKKKPGQKISLKLMRDAEEIELITKLGVRPGSRAQVPTVWLGVVGEDKDDQVVIKTVVKDGPAAAAGLKVGDVVLTSGGDKPKDYQSLIAQVKELAEDDKLKLKVRRGEEEIELEVVLKNRPVQQTQQRRSNAYMGIQGENAEGGGAKLTSVVEGGPSAKGGLKSGDVVIKVGDQQVGDYQSLIGQIRRRQPADVMKVTVKRGDKTVEVEVTLGDRRGSSSNQRPYFYSYFGQQANIQDMQGADGYKHGGIYKSTDSGETWERVNSLNTRPMYFSVIRVDPSDENRVYVLGVSQFRSTDGGMTFSPDFGRGVHADGHDLWINPNDGRHMVIGGDGGYYVTHDYGRNWDHINTAAIGQFYHVTISLKEPYWVVGGLQDNGSWGGPAISRSGGAINEDWISVGGGDGFVCRSDPNDPDWMYYESQNGNIARRNLRTGERGSIRPRPVQGKEYRFNWNTPFILSSHNAKILYSAGNYVFRSLDRGNNLRAISPEITATKRGSGTALSESPLNSQVLYAGTDDGFLWVTKDGGANWENITENLNAPGRRWVATIEASRFSAGRVYVCLDGHRSDDDNPYLFVSEDYGQTFAPLHKGLPRGSSRCLREDIRNPNLLFLGTEFAFWVSLDRGQNWTKFNQELPSVAIHEVAIHPTNGEIVLATHGRSLWACDVTALRNIDATKFGKEIAFYTPNNVTRWRAAPRRGRTNRRYVAENPARGAQFWYSLPEKVESAKIQIKDIQGTLLSELNAETKPGLHRAAWNLTRAARPNRGPNVPRTSSGFRGTGIGRPVPNGTYLATLNIDGKEVASQTVALASDPDLPVGAVADEVYEAQLLREEMARSLKSRAKDDGVDVRYYD